MKLFHALLAFGLSASLTPLVSAQTATSEKGKSTTGILGYLDPKTGAFRPIAQAAPEMADPLVAPTTGKFVIDLTITIQSSIAATTPISCGASASVFELGATGVTNTISEEASGTAVRTGSTARCTLTIPYSWILSTPASDTVTLGYSVGAVSVSATASTTRESVHSLAIKTPISGATTTQTITVVI